MHARLLTAYLFTTLSSVSAIPVSFSNRDLLLRELSVDNFDVYGKRIYHRIFSRLTMTYIAREFYAARDFIDDEADYDLAGMSIGNLERTLPFPSQSSG